MNLTSMRTENIHKSIVPSQSIIFWPMWPHSPVHMGTGCEKGVIRLIIVCMQECLIVDFPIWELTVGGDTSSSLWNNPISSWIHSINSNSCYLISFLLLVPILQESSRLANKKETRWGEGEKGGNEGDSTGRDERRDYGDYRREISSNGEIRV